MKPIFLKEFPITWSYDAHVKAGSTNPGIDLGTYTDPLFAFSDGRAQWNIDQHGSGYITFFSDDGIYKAQFVHLHHATKVGKVKAGEQIAVTGNSGTNPITHKPYPYHTHFTLFQKIGVKWVRIDPTNFYHSLFIKQNDMVNPLRSYTNAIGKLNIGTWNVYEKADAGSKKVSEFSKGESLELDILNTGQEIAGNNLWLHVKSLGWMHDSAFVNISPKA